MSTLIKKDDKWVQVAGGTRLWTGTKAQLKAALDAGELPDHTQVMVTDDYEDISRKLKELAYWSGRQYCDLDKVRAVLAKDSYGYFDMYNSTSVSWQRRGDIATLYVALKLKTTTPDQISVSYNNFFQDLGIPLPGQTVQVQLPWQVRAVITPNGVLTYTDTGEQYRSMAATNPARATAVNEGWMFRAVFHYFTEDPIPEE